MTDNMNLVTGVTSTGFPNILKRKSLHFLTNWSTLPWLDKIGQQATFLLAQLRFCPGYIWISLIGRNSKNKVNESNDFTQINGASSSWNTK